MHKLTMTQAYHFGLVQSAQASLSKQKRFSCQVMPKLQMQQHRFAQVGTQYGKPLMQTAACTA